MSKIFNKDEEFDSSFDFHKNEFDIVKNEKTNNFQAPYVDILDDTPNFSLHLLEELANLRQKLTNSELELSLVSTYLNAILDRLDWKHDLDDVLNDISTIGIRKNDVLNWWNSHKSKDIKRLKEKLNEHFSPQEIEVLKKLSFGGNIQ